MISRIHVKNFKCLLDVDIPLGPFNIFIGPNDSGKSSLLQAIKLLGQTAGQPLAQVFTDPFLLENLVWRRESNREILWKIEGSASDDPFVYQLALASGDPFPRSEELLVNGTHLLSLQRPTGRPAVLSLPLLSPNQQLQLNAGITGLSTLSDSPQIPHYQPGNPQAVERLRQIRPIIDSLSKTIESVSTQSLSVIL